MSSIDYRGYKNVAKLHRGYYNLFQHNDSGHTFLSRKTKPYVEGNKEPDCVVIKATDEQGRLLVIREYRPILGTWIWALPAGKIDANESMFAAAEREVREETGLQLLFRPGVDTWYSHTFASPGLTDEIVGLLLGEVRGTIKPQLDGDEQIEAYLMDPDDMQRAGLHTPGCPMSIWLSLCLI